MHVAFFLIILFTVILFLSLLFRLSWDGYYRKKNLRFLNKSRTTTPNRSNISFQIIHDAESIDADTNGQEMTVERHESYRNYNWSCHDTKLMKSAFILMVLI